MEGYRALYEKASADPEGFWAELAASELSWFTKWTKVFESDYPFVKWFAGGKINVSYNCIDRHLDTPRKNKVAILWEGEPGDQRSSPIRNCIGWLPVRQCAETRGIKAGDRAIIYMPMVPELPVALLACARLGITHSVVFGGFSAEA